MNKINSMTLAEKIILFVLTAYAFTHAIGVVIMASNGDIRSGSILWLFVLMGIIYKFLK